MSCTNQGPSSPAQNEARWIHLNFEVDVKDYQVVYPDEFGSNRMMDAHPTVQDIAIQTRQLLEQLMGERERFAISGAMRWYWSQEAPIGYEIRARTL